MASGKPSSELPLPHGGVDPETPRFSADSPKSGSSAEVALQFAGLDFSTHSVEPPVPESDHEPPIDPSPREPRRAGPAPALSWPMVILGSYASAVTLALLWVLATGKTLPRFQAQTSTREAEARSPVSIPAAATAPAPADRSAALGKTLVVGELELMPLTILHKTVRISRAIGLDGPTWENPDCLVLTIRLKNMSKDRAVTPLAPPSAQAEPGAKGSHIDIGSNRRLSMFDLNLEGEWVIDEQIFPTIAPGGTADIVLVSEPVPLERLVGPLTWWVALRTGGDEMDTVGVRFSRKDVDEVGGTFP